MRRSLPWALVILGLFEPALDDGACARAQGQPVEKRVVLTQEKPQLQGRLEALDRQMAPLAFAGDVGKFVGWSAPAHPLRAPTALMLDNSAAEKWEQVLENCQKLADDAGEALVPTGPGSQQPGRIGNASHVAGPSVQVRRLVHCRIAALPPSVLGQYRQHVDAQAQKLLEEGKDRRSAGPLRRLVGEFFCSRVADQALDLLGDLAFEQGDFEDALAWWRMLVPPPGDGQRPPPPGLARDCLLFPDPTVDSARVRAKEVLTYAFLGQIERARQELVAYQKLHPLAGGALAGGDGPYAAILETWIERLAEQRSETNREPWTTCAGNAARNRTLAVCPPARLWVDGPTWRVRLASPAGAGPVARASPATRLAFHPLIVDSQVLVADGRSVRGFHLLTGQELFRFVLKDAGPGEGQAGERPRANPMVERYTLTAWNKRVFARLGRQSLGPGGAGEKENASSTLVCLNLAGATPGDLLWQIRATTPENRPAFFEGVPLAAEGRVFSAVSWVQGQGTHTALACYDAHTGQRRWCQEICEGPEFEEHPEPRQRQHLVTMAGGKLYYCSHAGAVVALDPWSGQCVWGTRYQSRGPRTEEGSPSPRDLAPCVYADGRLYLAPLDADRLFCLDAADGRLLWESDAIEVVHLLGVARGRVFFTTPRGLQCLNAETGGRGAQTGERPRVSSTWVQPAEGTLPGLGRGLLAGSWLLWPTQDPKLPLRGVTLADGDQERFVIDKKAPPEPEYLEPTMLRAILPGNMAFGQDCLVVAGLEELAAYVPQRLFLKQHEKNLKEAKAVPLALYRLAMAQADARLTKEAEKTLKCLSDLTSVPATEPENNWHALSALRTAELRGAYKPSWKLRLVKSENIESDLAAKNNRPQSLELPLQKVLDLPANYFQSLAGPGAAHEGLVLGQRGNDIFCLDLDACKIRWTRSVNDQTLWLGSFANTAVRAAPDGLVGLGLPKGDGKHQWAQSTPLQPTLRYYLDHDEPTRLGNPFPPAHFRCNHGHLFFMVDQRLLAALDPVKGEYAWLFWAPGGQIRPLAEGGRFYPSYHAGDRFVLLQTSAGEWLTLDSQTGKLLNKGPATRPWPQPPLPLDERRFVLSAEAGRVVMLDAATGVVSWTYTPLGNTSLTGSPAQAFGDKDALLVLVPRNIGPELVRLDPANGKPLWSIPVLADFFDVQTAAVDTDAVYFACQNVLQARSLRDGTLLWKKKLPSSFPGWQSVRAGEALLIYPHEEGQLPWLPLYPCALSWPTWPVVQHVLAKPRQDRAILVIDPRNGQWMQRLPLGDEPGPITVQVGDNRLVVRAGGKMSIYRSLSKE